jgi:hypothetical protein
MSLSILISSRVKSNPDSNIKRLLDSAEACIDPEDYGKIEFLLKYDTDDDKRPDEDFFRQYKLPIRIFIYERGEGRHYNHHFSEFLFANRNTSFRWAASMADDFYFIRPGFMKDLEAIKDEYMVVGFTRPNFEINAVKQIYNHEFPYNFDHTNGIGEYCPFLTANIIEVCQNMGWQPNIDAWIVLLETKLFYKYGFLLWKQIEPFYKRGGGYGLGDTPTRKGWDIYNNMVITGARIPKNKYLFDLIDQQVTNLYLNMMYKDRPTDQSIEEKLIELRKATPIMDIAEQIAPEGWVHHDAHHHNRPPVYGPYQLQ